MGSGTPSPSGENFSILKVVRYIRKSTHAKFDIKHHIVWSCKYRYPVLQGKITHRARALIRLIAQENEVAILAGSISPNHIHMLVSAPSNLAPAKLVQYLKGTTSRKLQQEFPELKKKLLGPVSVGKRVFHRQFGKRDR